ncbi:MAG TPA: DUF5979 domain-containing protein [Microbacteriaceae bacterium]|nr:DUF5979 domain-containing protein [Microbacteriaceae bacterium]
MQGFRAAGARRRGRHAKPSARSPFFRLIAGVLVALLGIGTLSTAAAADDDPTSVLGLTKSLAPSTVLPLVPGGTVNYRVELVCSNLEPTGCLNAALTDVVPAPLVLNLMSLSVSGSTFTNTSSGNTIQLGFTQPVFGGVGLDDGSSVVVTYSATLPSNVSGDWNGVDLVNTAVFTAANAVNSGLSRAAVVTPIVPLTLVPGITKSFDPTSTPAVPGAPVGLTITTWNASNQSVDELTIQDPKDGSPNPFQDTLQIVGISQLTPPTGADRVAVQWLDAVSGLWQPASPVAQPIPGDPDDLLIGAPASADILGVRLAFRSSTGTIPVTAPGGEASIVFDTVIRTGVTAGPSGTTVENTATAQATKELADSGPVDAPATLTLQQAVLGPLLTKSFDDHKLVPGESTTASLEAGNGDYPIIRMDVTEPAAPNKNLLEQGLRFDGFVDADVEWPAGATDAVFTYFYDDGNGTPVPLTAPAAFPAPELGRAVTGFTVRYNGAMPPRAYAAIPFTVTALPVVGLLDITETNVAWAELERGDGLTASVTADDDLTRTPARVNTTIDKQIVPGDIWSVPGSSAVILTEAKVNRRDDVPDSTVGAQVLKISDPAAPSGTIDGFWDRFDLQAIAPTAVPANATVTANWWNAATQTWEPLPGATAVGPVSGWTYSIPTGIRSDPDFGGIQLVFEPTAPGTLLQPGFTVAPYFQVALRSDLRSAPGTPAVDPTGATPVPVPNIAQARVENDNADPIFAIDDDPAQIIVNPTDGPGPGPGPGSPLADKEWIDPAGDPSQIQARTANDAIARLLWTTSGLPLDRAVVTDPAPATATSTGLPAVENTVFDAFDLVSIAPIDSSTDPSMRFDAVTGVLYFSASTDMWVEITSTVCSPASACDGQFPGYTLTPTQKADARGVRLVFEESPTRASRITSPLDPAVGSGVARSAGFRPIDLTFEIRDEKRSNGDAVTGRASYNAGLALVDNTVRVDGWIDTTSYSTVADDDIMILDVPLNVTVTKEWDQTQLGLPPVGSDADRYPLSTATIVATNETAARVNTLELTDPNPTLPSADSAFEYLNLYQIIGVTVPIGTTSSEVVITYAADPLNPVSYTIAAAQLLSPATLADATAITVRHDGRIEEGASTELRYLAQLRAETRTSHTLLTTGLAPDNTVRAWVRDPGGTALQGGVVLDDDDAHINIVTPTYSVNAFKTITPEYRYQEQLQRNVTVELSGQPAGTVRTLEMTYTDADPRFWNAYDFTGFLPTTLVAPITRVEVEALVGVDYAYDSILDVIEVTCAGDTDLAACWQPVDTKTGTPGSSVTLVLGSIDPADIRGLRYTIDRADGANWERPYNARQPVRFTADRRVNLLIGPSGANVDPVPSTQPYIPPTENAPEETVLGRTTNELVVEGVGGWPRQITPTPLEWRETADADDYTDLLHRQNAVRIVKNPAGDVSPGTTIPFQIEVANTGDWDMTGLEIVDTIETDGSGARLVIPTTVPGDPAIFTYQLRNGSGVVQPAPAFTATPSVPLATITFEPVSPTFTLPSGWSLTITANLEVRADIPANENIGNAAVVTTDRVFDACVGAVNAVNQPVVNNVEPCTTTTTVHTVAASPLQIIKGVRGDGGGVLGSTPGDANYDDLGILAYPGAPSTAYCEDPNWDPDGTPSTGDEYYRSPCVPITRPGGGEEWRVDVKNSGNIPSTRLAMIDVLPSYDDRGVIIDQARSSRWTPTFLGDLVVSVSGTTYAAGAVVTVEYLPTVPTTVCNRLDILSQMTGQPVTPADLQPGEPASCITEVNGGRGWLTYDEGTMTPDDLAAVKALRIVVTYQDAGPAIEGLLPGETLTLVYRSQTAPYAERAESQDRDSIAWNSIAGGALGVDPANPATPYPSLIREPRKTGIAMALGKLELAKLVSTPGGWPFGAVMPDDYDFTLECTSVGEDVPLRGLALEDLSEVTLDADGTVLTINNGVASPAPGSTPWSYVNLPLYADCTITEVPTPTAVVSLSPASATAVRDFSTRTDVANPAWPTALTLQKVTATNTYSYTGFSVSKSVDIGPAVDESGTPIDRPGPYEFTATCSFLGASALSTTFSLADGDTWSSPTNIPAGSSCTVTETTANGAGNATTDITLTNGITDPPVPHLDTKTVGFVLAPDSTGVIDVSLAFENTFGAGRLRIDKAVTGAGSGAWGNADFTVDVVCTLASAVPSTVYTGSFTLSKTVPSTPVITNLATGASCAVSESAVGGANTTSVSPTSIVITNATATPQVVTATNTFQVGTVRVTKVLSGAPAASLAPATGHTYEFEITCTRTVNGVAESIDAAIPGGTTRTVTGAGSADWTGLPTGASCTVSETDSGLATSTTISPTGGTVTVGNGNTQTVTVTNVFGNGSLPVSKTVTGSASAFAPASFTATVSCTWNGAAVPLAAGGVITLTDGSTTTVSGVPIGSVCSVAENDHGQQLPNPSDPLTVTVTDGGTPTVTLGLTNLYEVASLTITKQVQTTSSPVPTGFAFSAVCTFNGAEVLNTTFTLDATEVQTFNGLPARSECTIVETDDRGADDTIVSGSSTGGAAPDQATRTIVFASLTADAAVAPVTQNSATFRNTYGVSGLSVTKALDGAAAYRGSTDTFPVDVYCDYGVDVLVDETVNLSAASPTASWTSVVPGAVCTITETDAGDADVTTIAIDGGAATTTTTTTITVVDGSVTDIDITNWYLTGSVAVTKFFEDGAAGAKFGTRDYRVELACTLGGTPFTVPGGGIRTLNATDPDTTYTGLPTGTECALAELDTGGAVSTRIIDATTGASGPTLVAPATAGWALTIDTTGAPLATTDYAQTPLGVVNRYEFAELSATKAVDTGGALDANGNPVEYGPFEVTLTCTLDGVAIDALESATQSFFHGDTVTWTELAVGADCIIEETDPADAASVELEVTQGATTALPVTSTSVVLDPLSDTASGGNAIAVANTYEAVSIAIEKRIMGTDQGRSAGPFPMTFVCTLIDASHPAPGLLVRDTTGDIGGPAALRIQEDDLPAGASCVVTETDAGTANATSISFDGGPAVPSTRGTFVLPLGLTTVATITVTNVFDLALTGSAGTMGGLLIGLTLMLWGAAAVIGIALWRRRRVTAIA